jgi:hypothetical protein
VCRELPAHTIVLEEGSSYFKGLFTTGQEMSDQSATKRIKLDSSTEQESTGQPLDTTVFMVASSNATQQEQQKVIDLLCADEEDAVAVEFVLSFLYSNTLPASPTANMLYKVCRIA